jgi:DNA-binding protein H-NS
MTTYKDLIEQRKALDEKIAEARRAESSGALATIRQLVEEFGFTADDIFGGKKVRSSKGTVVAPKYRDPATGATWTGRGKPPVWIKDKDRDAFAI